MGDMGDPPKKKRLISLCVGCGNQIHDQYILRVSPDLEWHAACLKCAECNQYLDETCTCFVRDGKTYCKRDYIRLYGIKCAKCSIGFSKNDFVMRARAKVYHIECFRCVACSRQLIPGDEFALREDGLFCRADHDVVERASLGGGDPLSPLHPARPLQMAGTARAQRRGNPRGLAIPGPTPGSGESPMVSARPAPPWRSGPERARPRRGGGGGAPRVRAAAGPAAARNARVRGLREAEHLRRGRAPTLQPALLLPPPRTECGIPPSPSLSPGQP